MQEQNLDQCLALFCWCTCRNPDFCFGASQGLSRNPRIHKWVPAFLSLTQMHAIGTDQNLKNLHAILVPRNHYRQNTVISYFACDPFIVIAESAPRFECLWALEREFQVCNPQLTNSAFIHYKPWEWGHLSTQASIGGVFFSTFKWSLSPFSCLQAAALADTVQLLCAWHHKHHVAWLDAISCKRLR